MSQIVLYNPFNRTHRVLPPLPENHRLDRRFYQSWNIGFGYDSLSDDYKVLRIEQFDEQLGKHSVASLYSLKNNAWEDVVDSMPLYFISIDSPVLFREVLHFSGYRNQGGCDVCVVCFDLRTNAFSTMKNPKLSRPDHFFIELLKLDGCLCLFVNYDCFDSELWVMKEYGNEGSWVKLLDIRYHDMYSGIMTRPVDYWVNERGKKVLLMLCYNRFLTYDWDTNEFEHVTDDGLFFALNNYRYDVWTLVESLVSLTVSEAKSKDMKGLNQRKKRKRRRIDSEASPSGHLLGSN